ncbi:hypothetical protein GPUN_1703 [Glaciecola punicea ACAM 611]|uniref:Uncharacterized protein n=1 Tax=Glaciecola punicea ACAM 611 TaxID=1121923 RepID=H5TBZ2_9ALTE|nr:hypothetical protein GPUN_1703 [Glaciecola punicea ACAM 611]
MDKVSFCEKYNYTHYSLPTLRMNFLIFYPKQSAQLTYE